MVAFKETTHIEIEDKKKLVSQLLLDVDELIHDEDSCYRSWPKMRITSEYFGSF